MKGHDEEAAAAIRAANSYFRSTPDPFQKGSAMSLIDAEKAKAAEKTERLRAARAARDAAQNGKV